MPHLRLNDGHRLFYTDSGGDGPVVLFSHGLLFTHAQFAAQIEALRGRYRCNVVGFPASQRSQRGR